jgi:hypothetical protein
MPARASRDLVRHVVLEAAAELWLEGGRCAVGREAAAARAERSPVVVASLFGSDRELADAACSALLADIETRMAQAVANAGPDTWKGLRQGLRAYVNTGLEWPAQYRLVVSGALPAAGVSAAPCGAALRDVLDRAMSAALLPTGDLDTAWHVAWSLVHGITATVAATRSDVVEADHWIESALDVVLAGLRHAHCLPSPPPHRAA